MDSLSDLKSLHHSTLLPGLHEGTNWIEENVSQPAKQALLADVWSPAKNAVEMLSGKQFFQTAPAPSTQATASSEQNTGDYLTRLVVQGSIAALTYAACGRAAGASSEWVPGPVR